MRRNPWWLDPLEELHREIERIFREFMPGGYTRRIVDGWRHPYFEVLDEGDKYRILIEIPGARKEDIRVKATENTITVEARISSESRLEEEHAIAMYRGYEGYRTTITLDEEIIPEKVRARYNNGLLEIEAPKKVPKEVEGVQIKVE